MEGVNYSTSFRNVILMLLLLGYWANKVQAQVESNPANVSSTHINTTSPGDNRDSKFLSLFSIVRFANTPCTGSNNYNGTCYTSAECATHGGTGAGSCASGFGVCCVVTISTCGTTTALNSTYWENPGYTGSYYTAGQCSLYVTKCSSNICQLRLDFIAFTIASPDTSASATAGQCLTDVFTVSGQSNPVPSICGTNTNQHIYLDMTPSTSTFSLNMILTGTTTARLWNMRISQIPCGTSYTAPDGCLQWFTDPTGTVMSFNYLFTTTPVVQHLAYQDYQICIRSNTGFCGIAYAVCSSTNSEPAFAISGATTGIAATTTGLADGSCNTDWLAIPCASDTMNSAVLAASTAAPTGPVYGCWGKLCGIFLNAAYTGGAFTPNTASATVYSYVKPFIMYFHTDATEYGVATIATSTESFGFCIGYTQQACTVTTSSG